MFKCREKGGEMGGENRVRFVFKMGLEGQLGGQLGGHCGMYNNPYKVKKLAKNGIFEPIAPPLIPK